uniref:Uncharacterized protein n=1 Tax=Rhizophora mucronata TaxID=61149 RepID=A0A2P2Q9L2_RHIMU
MQRTTAKFDAQSIRFLNI